MANNKNKAVFKIAPYKEYDSVPCCAGKGIFS